MDCTRFGYCNRQMLSFAPDLEKQYIPRLNRLDTIEHRRHALFEQGNRNGPVIAIVGDLGIKCFSLGEAKLSSNPLNQPFAVAAYALLRLAPAERRFFPCRGFGSDQQPSNCPAPESASATLGPSPEPQDSLGN